MPSSGVHEQGSLACLCSKVLVAVHPFGPILGNRTTRHRPFVFRIKVFVPFERPEFLEADFADSRAIRKHTVDVAAVPVYA